MVAVHSGSFGRRRCTAAALALVCLLAACSFVPPTTRTTPAPEPPLLLLISFDGFRWDALDLAPTPNLHRLAERGVRAERLIPAFPSKTFPNHYTIVTGLFPGHHGVIANTMRDAALGDFDMSIRRAVRDARWWGGEPLWVTVEKQGGRAAILAWPGSEAAISGIRPRWWRAYDPQLTLDQRVAWVLRRLSAPAGKRPWFATFYLEAVDDAGHHFSIPSPEWVHAVGEADRALGLLLAGLERLGLAANVHVVVVSDHGMTATSPERVILVDDLYPLEHLNVVDWSPLLAANPATEHLEEARRALARSPHLRVLLREETPAEWHYRDHPRIPRLLALADEGWTITSRQRVIEGEDASTVGTHGYDPVLPSMGGVFLAAGPGLRRGVIVPPFENVHLYALFCHLLGVEPAPNDGSLEAVRELLARPPSEATPRHEQW